MSQIFHIFLKCDPEALNLSGAVAQKCNDANILAFAAKFLLSKNHMDLENQYFLLKVCKYLPFTSKNNRQKGKFEIKMYPVPVFNIFLIFLKWAKRFLM